jgi:hypothetical protein
MGVPVFYKGELIAEHRRTWIVNEQVIVEIKSGRAVQPGIPGADADVSADNRLASRTDSDFNSTVMKDGVAPGKPLKTLCSLCLRWPVITRSVQ